MLHHYRADAAVPLESDIVAVVVVVVAVLPLANDILNHERVVGANAAPCRFRSRLRCDRPDRIYSKSATMEWTPS